MSIGDAYATVQQYRDSKEKSTVDDDTSIQRELVAVSRFLDQQLGHRLGFNNDGTSPADDVDRIYGPGSGPYLDINDHVSITTITVDENRDNTFALTLTATDYELLPRNATLLPEPEPYRTVMLTDYGALTKWPTGARVKVTGIGGWPAVPAAILTATIELTGILRLESPRATNRVNEMNQVLSTSRAAQDILRGLTEAYRDPRVLF